MAMFFNFHRGRLSLSATGGVPALPNGHFYECPAGEWVILTVKTSSDVTKKIEIIKPPPPSYDFAESISAIPGTSVVIAPGYRAYAANGLSVSVTIERFAIVGGPSA